MSKKKVVLIQGGLGAERQVSLSTGAGFKQALVELGYPFEVLDAREDLLQRLTAIKADVALLALHGKYAEDGVVQGICEYIKLPYSGSGVLASALCMDKVMTKQVLESQNIATPPYEVLDAGKASVQGYKTKLDFPVVVKPSREGSSVGISIVKDPALFQEALDEAAKFDRYILIEKFIAGVELTVPVLMDRALTPIEIEPKVDFYNYENKYTAGKTEYHMPARLPAEVIENSKRITVAACRALRVRCYGRVDFRVDTDGNLFIMEVNTLPGATPTSLLPKSARHEGINFNEVVRTLVEEASLDYEGVS